MDTIIKIGDTIRTLVDKKAPWGSEVVFVPKGSICLVCEVHEGGAIMIETPESTSFALVDYEKGEYEKIEATMSDNY